MLVSRRYERASMIVTSNKPFSAWGEIFGDDVVAAAMIDRLVHHAEILALKGDSYRLKDRDLARPPAARTPKRPEPITLSASPEALRTFLRGSSSTQTRRRLPKGTLRPYGRMPDRLRRPGIPITIKRGRFSTGAKGSTFDRP